MTTERETAADRKKWIFVALGGLIVGIVSAVFFALRPPPQMGADEGVFNTVDALYTAVRNRDEPRMAECEARLHAAKAAGKLPADSAAYLDGVIAKARGGGWDAAAERLYDFMIAQRREGFAAAPKPEKKSKVAKTAGK